MEDLFAIAEFPRSAKYHPEWIKAGISGGANPLWITEWLAQALDLRPGMRVLDLGCGRALSSIFLHREFGLQVWAVDLLCSVSENLQRIRHAGIDQGVFPLRADARTLPFGADFFDAIVSIDSFFYYGTDDLYLNELIRFIKPGGQIGIAGAGLMKEIVARVPEHLNDWWTPDLWCLHSAPWWKRHWERTGLMDIEVADSLAEGWRLWHQWHLAIAPDNKIEIDTLASDAGRYLGYTRLVGRKRAGVVSTEPILSISTQYTQAPLLRSPE
ncbi:SAM-dependent methyltransferase [Spirosoma luteum]|uniref:SAM-dependent methyltransferase n=1 Tax=Spirosoma luteum TaxID=431553 RepID=UPI0003641ABC|nr:class I SAM-dependent methyltransferase [Spirosoma luteum]